MQTITTITVSIRYFSVLAQLTNKRTETLTLTNGQDLNTVLDMLCGKYPDIQNYLTYIRVAVNQEYVSLDYKPQVNDEIALITPVSGG